MTRWSYKDVAQFFNMGFKQGALESWMRAKYVHRLNMYTVSDGVCVVCGRRLDHIYEFAQLTPVFFRRARAGWWFSAELGILLERGQSVMAVCEQHGGLSGSTVTNCHTGDMVYLKPRHGYYPVLNLAQGFILHTTIWLRWLWFYLVYLYNWIIGYRIAWWWRNIK